MSHTPAPSSEPETTESPLFSTANKVVMILGVLAFIGALIFLGISQNAADSDWAADRVTHSNCEVKSKDAVPMRSGSRFEVNSTCGSFETHAEVWDVVEVGKTYDLMTTPGNWAHDAYLLRADAIS